MSSTGPVLDDPATPARKAEQAPRSAPPATSSLAPFGALSCAYFASVGVFSPYAPLWMESLGLSALAIGTIASLQSWTRVLTPYAWAWVGDHWQHGAQRVTLLRWAAALALVFAALMPWVQSPAAVTLVVVLLFLANGGIVPLSEAVLAQHLSAGGGQGMDVGRYGRVRLWGSIGFIVAVALAGAVFQLATIAWLPAATVLVFGFLLAAAWRLPAPVRSLTGSPVAPIDTGAHRQPAIATATAAAPSVWAVVRTPEVAWFFAGVFFTVLAHFALYVFLSLYLVSLGYSKAVVGAMWAVSVAAEVVFFWRQGRWFARCSPHTWLLLAAVATAVRFAGLGAWAGYWPLLIVLQLLHALTFAAQHAACVAMVDRHFRGPLRGRGQALYTTMGYGASGVLGGVLGGVIAARAGYGAVFMAAAGVGLLAAACCWRCRRLAHHRGGADDAQT